MPKQTPKSTRIAAIFILAVFSLSLVAAAAVPLMNKKDQASSQSDIEKQLQELQAQQESEQQEPEEIDLSLKQEGAITTMQIIDITTGSGREAKIGDTINVKYKGALAATGAVFDSNSEGVEFPLEVGGLIEGWTEGVPGMREGGKRKLVIPAAKGYGAKGSGSIPPNSDLVFDIELISIK
ncbi:MAG: FKBP-type peptidyl-prolyl cis-trans isomerase FkpA [Patescibacteria group bacterium]|nr:FKBP-type peptidyl-prolyl cis-trans isomerase FkpA [Patescibacteria group bacterium]